MCCPYPQSSDTLSSKSHKPSFNLCAFQSYCLFLPRTVYILSLHLLVCKTLPSHADWILQPLSQIQWPPCIPFQWPVVWGMHAMPWTILPVDFFCHRALHRDPDHHLCAGVLEHHSWLLLFCSRPLLHSGCIEESPGDLFKNPNPDYIPLNLIRCVPIKSDFRLHREIRFN